MLHFEFLITYFSCLIFCAMDKRSRMRLGCASKTVQVAWGETCCEASFYQLQGRSVTDRMLWGGLFMVSQSRSKFLIVLVSAITPWQCTCMRLLFPRYFEAEMQNHKLAEPLGVHYPICYCTKICSSVHFLLFCLCFMHKFHALKSNDAARSSFIKRKMWSHKIIAILTRQWLDSFSFPPSTRS